MRIARIGNIGSERPVIIKEDKAFFIDKFIKDFDRETLTENLLSQLSAIDLTEVPNIDLKSLEPTLVLDQKKSDILLNIFY